MSEPLRGRCACSAVRYALASAPMFVHCCHCLDCQRQTGSEFVLNALIETARFEVSGTERLFPACTTPIQEGMSVTTTSPKLTRYRRISVELLFVERNHVCSVCVSNGHCELQSMATALGISTVGLAYNFPKLSIDMLDHNRCILCTRCVRVCAELEGAHVWDLTSRGTHARVVSEMNEKWGHASTCTSCGKCVHAGPTGALAEKGWAVEEMVKKIDAVTSRVHRRGVHV